MNQKNCMTMLIILMSLATILLPSDAELPKGMSLKEYSEALQKKEEVNMPSQLQKLSNTEDDLSEHVVVIDPDPPKKRHWWQLCKSEKCQAAKQNCKNNACIYACFPCCFPLLLCVFGCAACAEASN